MTYGGRDPVKAGVGLALASRDIDSPAPTNFRGWTMPKRDEHDFELCQCKRCVERLLASHRAYFAAWLKGWRGNG